MIPIKAILEGTVNLITGRMDAVAAVRLEICSHCQYYSYGFCVQCGCIGAIKTRSTGATCPKKKW